MEATIEQLDREACGLDPERPACEEMSERFAQHLREAGKDAHVFHAEDASYEHDALVDYHRWVEYDGYAYDWTVRQYYNTLGPAASEAMECDVPLVWPVSDPHPLMGFRTTRPLTGTPTSTTRD